MCGGTDWRKFRSVATTPHAQCFLIKLSTNRHQPPSAPIHLYLSAEKGACGISFGIHGVVCTVCTPHRYAATVVFAKLFRSPCGFGK